MTYILYEEGDMAYGVLAKLEAEGRVEPPQDPSGSGNSRKRSLKNAVRTCKPQADGDCEVKGD